MEGGGRNLDDILKTAPAVFAVGKMYQIMVPVKRDCFMWVRIGTELFADSCQGILRSNVPVHRFSIPMSKLDNVRSYTIICRGVISREPYFSQLEEERSQTYPFRPITEEQEQIYVYHVADAHGKIEPIVSAASFFQKKLNLLIMNGDMFNDSGKTEYFDNIYIIAGRITNGEIPIIFARGNHDCRGFYAEHIKDYIPLDGENTYYSFRLGPVWGMVLDCGEDKSDSHEEYSGTVCFHEYRKSETNFIKRIIEQHDSQYDEKGIAYRFVIVHNPFTRTMSPPFNIEQEIYSEWARLLREKIKPDIMLCGHTHEARIDKVHGDHDDLGQPCTVVIGGAPGTLSDGKEEYIGAAFVLNRGKIHVAFTDTSQKIRDQYHI